MPTAHESLAEFTEFCSASGMPLSDREQRAIRALFEDRQMRDPDLTEAEFLDEASHRILNQIGSFRVLHELLRQQHPEVLARVQAARRDLVDWVGGG